ncbi:MAG: redox-sensing transcriptional repressor Rex [Candidatus Omnitrophica bacterium]|nr:redox-sensing transcriptional repressor Rex [Candidatus Omnitrophota bacterium]
MKEKKIPTGTISRLFAYLREVKALSELNIGKVSSSTIGARLNLSDAQVRKDLGFFGSFGISGAGYNTNELRKALESILRKDQDWNICIAGAGRLGSALMIYPGFAKDGLNIVAVFDINPKKIGKTIAGITIEPMEKMADIAAAKRISIAIITTPARAAQAVADKIIGSGIRCIMNFAPVKLNVPEGVRVEDVDLSRALETLTFFA